MEWHSIHVHYHEPGLDRLIIEGIGPCTERLADLAEVDGVYFVRHWLRGPHVRLNIRTTRDAFRATVLPTAERIIGRFLAAHPSHGGCDEASLADTHRRLAELENEAGPLFPWHADNTVVPARYDGRVQAVRTAEAAQHLADFLTETTPLLLAMTEHVAAAESRRLALAFDLMVATAHRMSGGGIISGLGSLRSHAEAFLYRWPEGRGRRPAWDRHYAHHAGSLARRVHQVTYGLDQPGAGLPRIPFVDSWVRSLGASMVTGYQLVNAGRLSMPSPAEADQDAPDGMNLVDISPYHRAVWDSPRWQRIMDTPWMSTWRLALNYLYLHLTRLGVTPAERFLLCHLAANAIEDAYGVSAMDLALRHSGRGQEAETAEEAV